jgi:hypothetical protein
MVNTSSLGTSWLKQDINIVEGPMGESNLKQGAYYVNLFIIKITTNHFYK